MSGQQANIGPHVTSRKKRRGMIEKRRRDKINSSLGELRRLVPAAFEKQGSAKLEKAEILQMTVDYLRMLHARGLADSLTTNKHCLPISSSSVGMADDGQTTETSPASLYGSSASTTIGFSSNQLAASSPQHSQLGYSQQAASTNNISQQQLQQHIQQQQQQQQQHSQQAPHTNQANNSLEQPNSSSSSLSSTTSPSSFIQHNPSAHHIYNQHAAAISAVAAAEHVSAAYHHLGSQHPQHQAHLDLQESQQHHQHHQTHSHPQASAASSHLMLSHHARPSLLNLDHHHHHHHQPFVGHHYASHHHHHHHHPGNALAGDTSLLTAKFLTVDISEAKTY